MKQPTTLPPSDVDAHKPPTCYHCHDTCPSEDLRIDDKYFCCEGCQMVYEILETNNLCQYYKLDEKPGVSLRDKRDARAYTWLDDEETSQKLIRYQDGHSARVDFNLPQIHCASCIWLLEHLYRLDKGITSSKVNFLKKQVSIQYLVEETSLRKIAAMLAGIGYPPEIKLHDVANGASAGAIDRSLYYKIAAAGFAFGNIMLLSFPEYLGLEKATEARFFSIFGYLNLLLATPVLLYSANDYLLSAWNGLKHRHLNIDLPLSLGMLMLFGRSVFEIMGGTGAGYLDSFAGLVFFLLIGKWFQQKTYYRLSFDRDYKSYFPVAATVRQPSGEELAVPIQKLNPGDIILVRNEELIPADGILLKGNAQIDYSFVTGEATPQHIKSGENLFAGGKQMGTTIELSLTRNVSTSYLTQLWNDDAFKETAKSQASELADRAGRYFTVVILSIASLAFLWWLPHSMATAVNVFTAVLIIACPCAVALSIPFTLGNILRILGRNRFYVKNTQVLETMHKHKALVFDKTGTITNLSNAGTVFYPLEGQKPLSELESLAIKTLVAESNHPLSRQIYSVLEGQVVEDVRDFKEKTGLGLEGTILDKTIQLGSSSFLGLPNEKPGVFIKINGILRGWFESRHEYREGLQSTLGFFKSNGLDTFVLSGDNTREAKYLMEVFGDEKNLFFNQSPQDKLDFIKALQKDDARVIMLGDGLNDAGALRQSNLGIVVTENTNNFTPACDAILHAGEFARIPAFFELAHWGVRTVNRAYILAAIYNVIGLSYAITGVLSPIVAAILMPLSSVTIVLFGVGMSHWKAYKLGLLESQEDAPQ
jgi:Cu+-exporting ATPase